MADPRKVSNKIEKDIIDPVEIKNQFCIFSNIHNDPLFRYREGKNPIFCAGNVLSINKNVYNINTNDFVGYITEDDDINIRLSANLVIKLPEKEDLELITILPYASFAMKVLRIINPNLGSYCIIFGLNLFSILLYKILNVSGCFVKIINLQESEPKILKLKGMKQDIIYNLDELSSFERNSNYYNLIINTRKRADTSKYIENIEKKRVFNIEEISIFDKGLEDENFKKGVKYPYPYVRWSYCENINYFIELVKNKQIELNFFEKKLIEVKSIEEIFEIIKELSETSLYIFKIKE